MSRATAGASATELPPNLATIMCAARARARLGLQLPVAQRSVHPGPLLPALYCVPKPPSEGPAWGRFGSDPLSLPYPGHDPHRVSAAGGRHVRRLLSAAQETR